jgi:septum formation protein
MSEPVLCLASASPRRRELLRQLGVAHVVAPAAVDETQHAGESASDYVLRLSRAKAARVFGDRQRSRGLPVLGADTTVVADDLVLGKPRDAGDAAAMLRLLSGREHTVLSAVTLATGAGFASSLARASVRMRPIAAAESAAYWATGEPLDKAGGYAIQGFGAAFVEALSGSYSAVVGLPLYETAGLLAAAGVPMWRTATA